MEEAAGEGGTKLQPAEGAFVELNKTINDNVLEPIKHEIKDATRVFAPLESTFSEDLSQPEPVRARKKRRTFRERVSRASEVMNTKAEETFMANLPSEDIKNFPRRDAIFWGIIAYCISAAIYIYFLITAYRDRLNESYVSFDKSAGVCSYVTKPLTGDYYASDAGLWEGVTGFQYVDARYQYSFSSLQATNELFSGLISNTFDLSWIANYTATHDMGQNILAWMHYQIVSTTNGNDQLFQFAARPVDVFNKDYYFTGIMNASTSCLADSTIYDSYDAIFDFFFEYSAECEALVSLLLSTRQQLNPDTINMRINMNTMSVAAAVNEGLYLVDELEITGSGFYYELTATGEIFLVTPRYDPRYIHADEIYCLQAVDPTLHAKMGDKCLVIQNDVAQFPVLIPYDPLCVDCATSSACSDDIDIVQLVLFSPKTISEGGLDTLLLLMRNATIAEVNIRKLLNQVVVEDRLDHLETYCPDCTLVFINAFGSNNVVSPFYFELDRSHCYDSVSIANFSNLAENPPVQLVEEFFRCKDTELGALNYAIGIAFGNMGTFAPIVLFIIMPLIYWWVKNDLKKQRLEEALEEKQEQLAKDFFMDMSDEGKIDFDEHQDFIERNLLDALTVRMEPYLHSQFRRFQQQQQRESEEQERGPYCQCQFPCRNCGLPVQRRTVSVAADNPTRESIEPAAAASVGPTYYSAPTQGAHHQRRLNLEHGPSGINNTSRTDPSYRVVLDSSDSGSEHASSDDGPPSHNRGPGTRGNSLADYDSHYGDHRTRRSIDNTRSMASSSSHQHTANSQATAPPDGRNLTGTSPIDTILPSTTTGSRHSANVATAAGVDVEAGEGGGGGEGKIADQHPRFAHEIVYDYF